MFYIDPLYIGLIVITLVVMGAAQLYIRSTYGRWSKIQNAAGLTGAQVAQYLQQNVRFGQSSGGVAISAIQIAPGELSDHFNPGDRSLGLSQAVASQPSVASMAVAAHEIGHAQQFAEGTVAMRLRGVLVPGATAGPGIAYFLIFIGFIFQLTGLLYLGIAVFAIAVAFSILTLPVEIGASRRAIAMLDSTGLLRTPQDREGVNSMLRAAALTYVAAAVTSVLTLLYYLSLARRGG
jgi:uncharacterized protein